MKKLLSVIPIILTFCHQISGYSNQENVKGSTEFSFDLYKKLYNQNENLVVSPYLFRILLAILYQSAYGTAESELREKVYFGEQAATLEILKSAIDHFTSSPNVKVANKLFLRQGVTLKPSFKTIVTEYKSDTELVDFAEGTKVANNMNQWVEENTNGLIKNLVSSDMITPDTALFIINTLYFKAIWQFPFQPDSVHKKTFHGYGKNYSIDFMSNEKYYSWLKLDEYKAHIIELPYRENSNFVFWILLPFITSNIRELKSHLNYNFINQIKSTLNYDVEDELVLFMPLFEIESTINGKDAMKKLGIETIFTRGEMKILEGDEPLLVSDICQKSKITVNTEGTEAVASSFAELGFYSFTRIPPPPIHVDRPFIYMIMTEDTKEPVFVGHFLKP